MDSVSSSADHKFELCHGYPSFDTTLLGNRTTPAVATHAGGVLRGITRSIGGWHVRR